ncbi:MAG: hypothetical protein PVI90_16565 [Desulfobacteraceae bacterium]|jgi:hypothetical protein
MPIVGFSHANSGFSHANSKVSAMPIVDLQWGYVWLFIKKMIKQWGLRFENETTF